MIHKQQKNYVKKHKITPQLMKEDLLQYKMHL